MNNKDVLILGPCCMESRDMYIETGKKLVKMFPDRNIVYKSSFDKANRSSIEGKRGIGFDEALELFRDIKTEIPGIKLTTDVHECWQIESLAESIDVVQIPAFLCRQTDLLVESARNFPVVNIKKGQWMSPQNMVQGVDKIKNTNPNCEAWITERGTQFGYGQLIVDLGSVELLSGYYDKVIFDTTHSTQRLKPNGRTGGSRDVAKSYIMSSCLFGYDGIFAETHECPPEAYSDGDCQIYLSDIADLIEKREQIKEIGGINFDEK